LNRRGGHRRRCEVKEGKSGCEKKSAKDSLRLSIVHREHLRRAAIDLTVCGFVSSPFV
jgi:hypothetical protein